MSDDPHDPAPDKYGFVPRYLDVAREAYWHMLVTWQDFTSDVPPKPFNMNALMPEAYSLMNESDRRLYRALCKVSWHKIPEGPANVE